MKVEPRIDAFDIAASGLRAQRLRMEVLANNVANVETTFADVVEETSGGQTYRKYIPYHRRNVIFSPGMPEKGTADLGVQVLDVILDPADFRRVPDPTHEHAVKNPNSPDFGYVLYPNVNPIVEFTDMIAASRVYGANLSVLDELKTMGEATLRILA